MTIEPKYEVEETVFVLDENKIWQRKIIVIDIWVNKESVNIKYKMASFDMHKKCKEYYSESECFATKEALLQSL